MLMQLERRSEGSRTSLTNVPTTENKKLLLTPFLIMVGICLAACNPNLETHVGAGSVRFEENGCVAYLWANSSNPLFSPEATAKRIEEQILLEPSNSHVSSMLMAAVARRNVVEVDSLLSSGVDVKESNSPGCTALIWASALAESEIVAKLIEAGADVDQTDTMGRTPLMLAAISGDVDTIQLLLDAGADINHRQTGGINEVGKTALHNALNRDRNGVVLRLLVESGADPSNRDALGQTPLDEAHKRERLQAISYLESLEYSDKSME